MTVAVALYLVGVFFWLKNKPNLPSDHVLFWTFDFGLPHALNALLLTCHISHVVRLHNARISYFRNQVVENSRRHFESVADLWKKYFEIRHKAANLSFSMKSLIGIYFGALSLAVLFHVLAVSTFEGEVASLVYMVLNVVNLLWIMVESQAMHSNFKSLCDDIMELPEDSIMGPIGGMERNGFMPLLQRTHSGVHPAMTVFGLFEISTDNFRTVLVLSIGSIITYVWVCAIFLFHLNACFNCFNSLPRFSYPSSLSQNPFVMLRMKSKMCRTRDRFLIKKHRQPHRNLQTHI